MKKKILLLMFIAILAVNFCCAVSWAQGALDEKQIVAIQVKGNYAISTTTILNKLKIKVGDVFEESALNKELKRLYGTGYFSDVFIETEDSDGDVVVILAVVEKPVIEKIEFTGNAHIKTARLLKKSKIVIGGLLDYSALSTEIAEIQAFYLEKGYSNVRVDYTINTDPETGKATVVFKVDEGLAIKIKSIKFEGNVAIPTSELEKYMSTKTAWWFIRKGAFDAEKFEEDKSRITNVYRSKGFLDAQVNSREEYSDDGKEMHLIVIVNEGTQYLVGDITIKGELAFPEEELRAMLKMKNGDAFDYGKIKEDLEDVRTFYYNKGYMNAEVNLQHKYNSDVGKMDLEYYIVAHDEVYVGRINVIGNIKTKDKVIRRELRVYPGEKYEGATLKRSKERIYDLGFFEDVYFETIPTDDVNVKDLNVTVKETKTGEFSFGGGYSSVDSFLGFVQIRQRNFDITNFPTFTGGGQSLTIRGEVGASRTNYLLSWVDPWIFDYPLLFGFDVYRREQNRFGQAGYGYDETRTGGSLQLGKELTEEITVGAVYNVEEVKISNIPSDATADLKKELGTNWISRITGNLRYDTRDNRYSPTKGWLSTMSLENAGGFIGGTKDFVKGYSSTAYYYSIVKNVVVEIKGRSGMVESYADSDSVPIYERFFAGGATTIRGYRQRGVGPRDRGSNVALGGEAMLIGNAEVVFPIFKKVVKGAVFYDVGNVWANSTDMFKDTSGYKQGAGIGVRVKTPIGPVKLDWGYPLSDNYNDKKEGQFYFSVSHGF